MFEYKIHDKIKRFTSILSVPLTEEQRTALQEICCKERLSQAQIARFALDKLIESYRQQETNLSA